VDIADQHITKSYEPMKNSTLHRLRKLFRPHNERLFKFLGREVAAWDLAG
jgi:hypothetical protein